MKGSQLDFMFMWLQNAFKSGWKYHGSPKYKTKPNLFDRECNFIAMSRSLILKWEKNLPCLSEIISVLYEVTDNAFMHQIILVKQTLDCSKTTWGKNTKTLGRQGGLRNSEIFI